ncbi:hypothetical protein PRK78_003008 [Emydomyces testavorans]|uniref:Uncharacterized protein n=1 Tax=Emydomyces testavorans TaxID=2070801 RepID=A0AAF0DFA8_9EURO|nr:hypothetical protein PRK78_003008 [Emydomyces testavorans]
MPKKESPAEVFQEQTPYLSQPEVVGPYPLFRQIIFPAVPTSTTLPFQPVNGTTPGQRPHFQVWCLERPDIAELFNTDAYRSLLKPFSGHPDPFVNSRIQKWLDGIVPEGETGGLKAQTWNQSPPKIQRDGTHRGQKSESSWKRFFSLHPPAVKQSAVPCHGIPGQIVSSERTTLTGFQRNPLLPQRAQYLNKGPLKSPLKAPPDFGSNQNQISRRLASGFSEESQAMEASIANPAMNVQCQPLNPRGILKKSTQVKRCGYLKRKNTV